MNRPEREGFVVGDQATVADVEIDQPAAPPAAPVEVWPIKVRLLHHSIRDNKGDEVRELSFREPTGADINRYGNPCRVNTDGECIIDDRRMMLIMAGLTGILSPLLERMDPRDYNSCAYRLRGFFLPDISAWL